GRGCASRLRDVDKRAPTSEATGAALTPERRVGHHRDARLLAAIDDSASQSTVVEQAERDLDGRDRRELERLVEPEPVDVREPDAPDEPGLDEPSQCPNRCGPGCPWIGRMEEIEIDCQSVERREARLAIREDRPRAAVGSPCAAGPG